MTNIRSCGEYYFSPENLKKHLVNTDENSVTLFLHAFLEKLDRDDFKFIRPAQDFTDVSVRNLYDLMSMPDEQLQMIATNMVFGKKR